MKNKGYRKDSISGAVFVWYIVIAIVILMGIIDLYVKYS